MCIRDRSYAIPAYRLPKEIVRRFVGALEHMGVAFRCGCAVGTDIQLEEIYQDSDGVMLDTGTWKRPLIGLAGEELTRFGLEFLVDVNNYILEKPGSDVVVVGGGNVAMDVAKMCIRDRNRGGYGNGLRTGVFEGRNGGYDG